MLLGDAMALLFLNRSLQSLIGTRSIYGVFHQGNSWIKTQLRPDEAGCFTRTIVGLKLIFSMENLRASSGFHQDNSWIKTFKKAAIPAATGMFHQDNSWIKTQPPPEEAGFSVVTTFQIVVINTVYVAGNVVARVVTTFQIVVINTPTMQFLILTIVVTTFQIVVINTRN
jgi:hypothetical protein